MTISAFDFNGGPSASGGASCGKRERNRRGAAGARAGNAGGDRRIHAVEIDRQVVAPAIGNACQHRLHAVVMDLIGADQMGALSRRGIDLLLRGTAGGAQPDLEDVVHMLHL